MARFKLEDGTIVDTARAAHSWDEASFWDGRNYISKATGDQFTHETLYKSAKGRYYIVHSSQWQGSRDHAEEIPARDAAAWLLQNEHELPEKVPGLIQDFSHPQEGYTLYFGRDRGDIGAEARACRDREAMLDIAAHNGSEAAYLFSSAGQWLFQSVNWRLPRPAAFKPLKEATIADLRDLIGRIPSFTHLSEVERQEYARESQAALEMVSNV